jgi:hypothetical protein
MFEIRMGVPEMKNPWDPLNAKNKQGRPSKGEAELYKKCLRTTLLLRGGCSGSKVRGKQRSP